MKASWSFGVIYPPQNLKIVRCSLHFFYFLKKKNSYLASKIKKISIRILEKLYFNLSNIFSLASSLPIFFFSLSPFNHIARKKFSSFIFYLLFLFFYKEKSNFIINFIFLYQSNFFFIIMLFSILFFTCTFIFFFQKKSNFIIDLIIIKEYNIFNSTFKCENRLIPSLTSKSLQLKKVMVASCEPVTVGWQANIFRKIKITSF